MSRIWRKLSDKNAQLQPREKGIIFVGVLLVVFWLNYMYLIEPALNRITKATDMMGEQAQQIDTTQRQIGLYQGALGKDPNEAVNKSIAETEQSIEVVDQTLSELTANFISPHKMREVLSELLKSDEQVKVTDFKAIPASRVDIDGVPASGGIIIYQHGIRMSVTGSYYDLQRYVSRIEQLPWRFYWKSFAYSVEQYPKAKLEIEIMTISTNEQFIAI